MFRRLVSAVILTAAAHAGVEVLPVQATLAPGGTCAFTARMDPPWPEPGWTWTVVSGPGAIDPDTGVFRAAAEAGRTRLLATLRDEPALRGEAAVVTVPLPAEVLELVNRVQGEGWVEPFSAGLPFLDLETGVRFTPERVEEDAVVDRGAVTVGYGLPWTLTWGVWPGVAAQLLSYREGDAWVRLDVTGRNQATLTHRGQVREVRVEALVRNERGWRSVTRRWWVRVRGVLPGLGEPGAVLEHRDGTGTGARFMEPFGIAMVGAPGLRPKLALITDRKAHVLRLVEPGAKVTTLAGVPGRAGHRDSASWTDRLGAGLFCRPEPGRTLFNAPTYVLAWPKAAFFRWSWEALVADSGNHCLRRLEPDGQVGTFAGRPGLPGHQDADRPEEARFHHPQGLARMQDGRVFVADQGNHVIRTIAPNGQVTTLAGLPGTPGAQDGIGPQARFTCLKDLVLDNRVPGEPAVLVLDGHALRRVEWPSGRVSTWLGAVDRPGWRDLRTWAEESHERPCLADPTGLARLEAGWLILDRGNRCLRYLAWNGYLETLAGAPDTPVFRCGLESRGLAAPLDEGFAGLGAPWTVAVHDLPGLQVLATTGAGVALANLPLDGEDFLRAWLHTGAGGTELRLATLTRAGGPTQRPMHISVEYLDAEGERLGLERGFAQGVRALALAPPTGAASVVYRCVTDQGAVAGAHAPLAPGTRD